MIAYDLGMPLQEVAQHGARPAPYGGSGGGRKVRTHDDGQGYGAWDIIGVEE
jgi:hypothetical protein